jgi:hypothetical protein
MLKVYTKVFKNVNEKNIDKFENCVIKLLFDNILTTYTISEVIGREEMISSAVDRKQTLINQFIHYLSSEKNASYAEGKRKGYP